MEQDIFFMSGFPRAGTTLLMNILNQNPKFHGTATSGLITSVINVKENWSKSEIYKSNEETYVYPKIKSMLSGMIHGFYKDELEKGIIPIDKNRAWVGNLDLLDEIFNTKVKFIYPIRHIIDCLISFEKIERKSSLIRMPNDSDDLSTVGRAEKLLSNEGILGLPIIYLREVLYRKEWDRLILVPFDDLLNYPELSLKRLYYQMGIKYFNHDLNNIKQTINEYDIQHGYAPNSLHKITEGKIMSPKERDLTIFDNDFIYKIENELFSDITELINNNTYKK